jgi:hypothetical protein
LILDIIGRRRIQRATLPAEAAAGTWYEFGIPRMAGRTFLRNHVAAICWIDLCGPLDRPQAAPEPIDLRYEPTKDR